MQWSGLLVAAGADLLLAECGWVQQWMVRELLSEKFLPQCADFSHEFQIYQPFANRVRMNKA